MEEMFFSGCGIRSPLTLSPPKKLIDVWIKVWMKNAVVLRLPSLSLKTATGSRAAPARPLSAPLQRGATRRSLLYRGSLLVAEKGRAHIRAALEHLLWVLKNYLCNSLPLVSCRIFTPRGRERVRPHVCRADCYACVVCACQSERNPSVSCLPLCLSSPGLPRVS